MRYKVSFSLLVLVNIVFAQQTPQWIMPFYFETADGQKDTVYIGYDPSASESPDVIDEQFYDIEHYILSNLDFFNVYVEGSLGCGDNYYDIRKTTIRNDLDLYTYINFVGVGDFPITMKWDYSQLYSENLPDIYQVISDRPRARIDIYPEIFNCDISCHDDCYYMCTDSLYPEINNYLTWDCNGILEDSVYFNSSLALTVEEGQGIMIRLRQYDTIAHWWSDTKIEKTNLLNIQVSPNPSNGLIRIGNLPEEQLSIEIYDFMGRIVKSGNYLCRKEVLFDMEALIKGIYILRISDCNNSYIYSEKIIKL
ncbi:MAG: T9SS type A sorting domain-containing protein [Bacteroidales bacterium]|nr:T9SS type A sorting domain-containing protein [Bacteroidales bacterium]MDY0141697.1 T9SS type A sorting domain-containing protein [Bacteroidales bacterium]